MTVLFVEPPPSLRDHPPQCSPKKFFKFFGAQRGGIIFLINFEQPVENQVILQGMNH